MIDHRRPHRADDDNAAFARPDTFSYNNMLNLYATRGDVGAAEALLRRMETSVDGDGVASPDVYSYSITMNAFQRRFTSCSRDERDMMDLERAEGILSRLTSRYEGSGYTDVRLRPTNVTFGTIMSMYAQADRMLKQDDKEGPNKTRKWKADQKMVNNKDDAKNVGWGARNAERVLDWMIGLCERERRSKNVVAYSGIGVESVDVRHGGFNHDNELIRPNVHNFVTVMDAWAKAGKGVEGAEHCQRLLDRLVLLYDKFGYVELRPNPKVRLRICCYLLRICIHLNDTWLTFATSPYDRSKCFGAVIDAWSKADDKYETAEKAEAVLNRMESVFLHSKSNNPREQLGNIAYNSGERNYPPPSMKSVADRTTLKLTIRLLFHGYLFLLPVSDRCLVA
jgi:pentatricopeptide repeat protein